MAQFIQEQVPLRDYTTFKIGGPAKFLCLVKTLHDMERALAWAQGNKEKVYIMGGGSNILFSDAGFDGLVIRMQNDHLDFENAGELTEGLTGELNREILPGNTRIICQAGVNLSRLAGFAAENGLAGMEWATGIFGTVGGAVRGNAGAFGKEMKDVTMGAKALNITELGNQPDEDEDMDKDPHKATVKRERKLHTLTKDECQFGYRDSLFKKRPEWIFWEGIFELSRGERQEIRAKMKEILQQRAAKQPNLAEYPSAGSVFKNAEASPDLIAQFEHDKGVKAKGATVPAGWLIDICGLRGKKIGGAMVSEKQANFIVNAGGATARDVLMLISIIKEKVRNRCNIQLQEELETVL